MRPLVLRLHNCRTFADAELTFLPGVTVLLGANGAGKSTLMDALRYALTGFVSRGVSTRDHAALLNPGGYVELDVTAGGEVYRIRREWKRSATVRFMRRAKVAVETWEGLEAADIPATLGLGERPDDLLRHTVLCGQGDLSALTDAAPAYRKELLGEALGLREYGLVAEAAKARADAAQRVAETAAAVLATWEPIAAEREARQTTLDQSEEAEETAEREAHEKREAVTQAVTAETTAQGAVERWTEKSWIARAGADGVRRLNEQAAGDRAHREALCKKITDLPRLRETAATAPALRARRDELKARAQAVKDAQAALETVVRERHVAEKSLAEAETDATLLTLVPCAQDHDQDLRLAAAHRECGLLANARARAETADQLRETVASLWPADAQAAVAAAEAAYTQAGGAALAVTTAGALEDAEQADAQVRALAAAETELAGLEADLKGLDERIREHQAIADGLAEASENLREAQDLAARAAQAAQAARSAAREAETLLKAAQQTAADARAAVATSVDATHRVETAQAEVGEAGHRAAVARELQARCGRDGIPARLVEQSLGDIEARANDLLELLSAGTMRLAVATTKDLANGRIVEALEFVVATSEGERPYRLLSGGERVRVDLALRVGIAQLLAHRAGVAPEFLVLDEPASGLDAQGLAALVEGLPALAALFPGGVVVVEHIEALKEAGDRTFVVVKRDGVSVIEEAA